MSSMITNITSTEARGGPDPDIVQTYKARLQALEYSPGLTGKCIRTILPPHHMVVSERDRDRDARRSRLASLPEPRLCLSRSARLP